MADFTTTLAEFARQRYALPNDRLIRSSDEALEYLQKVGYCLLSRKRGIVLPNLSDISDGHFLRWKDVIIKDKKIFYGRPFRRRSGFVRLDLLPNLYALSPTADFGGDRFELYKRRFISAEANRIAGIVFAKGPLPTRALRRESGMAGRQHRDRFLRRLAEVEGRFLIVKTGLTTVEASHYSYLWEPFDKIYPKIIKQSYAMTIEVAATNVILTYLDEIGAATVRQIASTFNLHDLYLRQIADQLIQDKRIAEFTEGKKNYLISTELKDML
jgi:hypothetical protein